MFSTRWLVFNLVGLAGAAVQLTVVALLSQVAHLNVPVATALAVEAAILHNFLWHQKWTWRERTTGSRRETLERLARFHALNGLVSLGGNVLITAALAAHAGMHPVAANLVAIAACSCVNYLAGDRMVFRTTVLLFVLLAPTAARADQSQAAHAAWSKYVSSVEQRFEAPPASGFFALDMRNASRWRDRARAGEVPMVEVAPPGVPDAKVHHWAGAIYVPNTTVAEVVRRLKEYAGREAEFYEEVKASRLLHRQGDRVRVFMRLYRDAGPVDVTYNTEHDVEYRRLDTTRAASRSVATKIAELDSPGTPREREKAPGDDSGFLWRLNAYWRYEQLGNGVLIECESVSLSRSVPFLIRPLANPIVNRIARESLANTLRSLRRFLHS